ncbi:glycosyltransferase family 4 protein [Thomasclavelia sp.]
MKKICFITTVSGTLKSFVIDTAIYLHNNCDYDISFICNDDEDFKDKLPEYINYYPVSMKRGISLSGIKAILKMIKIFKEKNFDLIQYSTPNASLYASVAGIIARVPIRLYCQWGMAYIGFSGIKRFIFKIIEKFICKISIWIEPDSYSNLDFAHKEKLYPINKGSVIWNGSACGVNLDKFNYENKEKYRINIRNKLSIPNGAFVFGFVGRITRDKGINELFEACHIILKNYKNVYLLLVGSEEIDENINEQLYNWSKKNRRVIYSGSTLFVEQYLSAMDCCILPSYREGFGMSVVEAEAMGVPVIVTNIPGPIDAMKNNETGLIIEKKDIDSLKKAMIKLLENDDLCKKFGDNGVKFAKDKFDQQTFFNYIKLDRERLFNKYLKRSREE